MSLRLYNSELEDDGQGRFVPEDERAARRHPERLGPDGDQPYAEVRLDLPEGECGEIGPVETAYSISGWWRVITGGEVEGEIVEVEVGDVQFDATEGGHLRLVRAYWRARLLTSTLEPPRGMDP